VNHNDTTGSRASDLQVRISSATEDHPVLNVDGSVAQYYWGNRQLPVAMEIWPYEILRGGWPFPIPHF
jgi:hypothetical protein